MRQIPSRRLAFGAFNPSRNRTWRNNQGKGLPTNLSLANLCEGDFSHLAIREAHLISYELAVKARDRLEHLGGPILRLNLRPFLQNLNQVHSPEKANAPVLLKPPGGSTPRHRPRAHRVVQALAHQGIALAQRSSTQKHFFNKHRARISLALLHASSVPDIPAYQEREDGQPKHNADYGFFAHFSHLN